MALRIQLVQKATQDQRLNAGNDLSSLNQTVKTPGEDPRLEQTLTANTKAARELLRNITNLSGQHKVYNCPKDAENGADNNTNSKANANTHVELPSTSNGDNPKPLDPEMCGYKAARFAVSKLNDWARCASGEERGNTDKASKPHPTGSTRRRGYTTYATTYRRQPGKFQLSDFPAPASGAAAGGPTTKTAPPLGNTAEYPKSSKSILYGPAVNRTLSFTALPVEQPKEAVNSSSAPAAAPPNPNPHPLPGTLSNRSSHLEIVPSGQLSPPDAFLVGTHHYNAYAPKEATPNQLYKHIERSSLTSVFSKHSMRGSDSRTEFGHDRNPDYKGSEAIHNRRMTFEQWLSKKNKAAALRASQRRRDAERLAEADEARRQMSEKSYADWLAAKQQQQQQHQQTLLHHQQMHQQMHQHLGQHRQQQLQRRKPQLPSQTSINMEPHSSGGTPRSPKQSAKTTPLYGSRSPRASKSPRAARTPSTRSSASAKRLTQQYDWEGEKFSADKRRFQRYMQAESERQQRAEQRYRQSRAAWDRWLSKSKTKGRQVSFQYGADMARAINARHLAAVGVGVGDGQQVSGQLSKRRRHSTVAPRQRYNQRLEEQFTMLPLSAAQRKLQMRLHAIDGLRMHRRQRREALN